MKKKQPLPSLMLATIGVVFGDIGTSPLYTLKECFSRYYGFQTQPHIIFGFLSLIFWMLIVIVSIKYIIFVMRADNKGEGGIIALMSLTARRLKPHYAALVLFLGLIGTSFFYGEVVITPAMTVLSAVEGLEIAAPHLADYVIPITIAVLAVLFLIQRKGSGGISKLFSPIMLLWFIVIAVLGICSIVQTPQVLAALNPYWAAQFLVHYKMSAFFALGATVLAITGTEALYADMGHFGRTSIRLSWLMVVLPALVLNYFGQGALLLRDPSAITNPFYLLVPSWAIIPLLILATFAAIIASQAVISGVFSLTRQAMNLGYIAPMRVKHTSEHESGQIYLPFVNWLLFLAVIIVVLGFKHSSHLAAAYGIAVTGTMVISSILISITAFKRWRWPLFIVIPMMLLLLCIDIPIFSANTVKIINGGWLPLAIGCVMFIIMTTWKKERTNLFKRLHERGNSLEAMIAALEKNPPLRVQGTAIYLSRNLHTIPVAFTHNLKHNKVMHERIIILSLKRKDEPYVHNIQRLKIEQISTDFWRVQADFGYLESPNMEQLFYRCTLEGLPCQLQDCSFFMSDQTLILEKRPWYLAWRSKLFMMMYRNALRAAGQFDIPPDRVIELGSQVEI